MSAKNKDLACQRMREFVIATRTLIDEEGEGALSIRRIAEIAGYHNSTIFLYFKDLDALLALVSIGYLSEYNSSLASLSQKRLSALRYFYEIWESFCLNVFRHIELSRRFFYGKYRDKLTQFFILYYHIFPEERKAYTELIGKMYFGQDIASRSLSILRPLIGRKDCKVTEENAEILNSLIVAFLDSMLSKSLLPEETDASRLSAYFMTRLHFLIDA